MYQFYKDVDSDDCAISGNEWEWTDRPSFDTGPNAITLSSFTAASALPDAIPWLAGAALALGGVLAWRRKRG